jgi:hypothetical protein
MEKRITVKLEIDFSDTYFTRGTDKVMTDADLKSFAIDEFIADVTRMCEEKELRRYVQVSTSNPFSLGG